MRTIMVTGSTQGLGLETARKLAKRPETQVILAVRNIGKGQDVARGLGKNVSAVHLDLSSLAAVRQFTESWTTKLDGLINNAGVQLHDGESYTKDNLEETIAVNHLAAFQLTMGLEPHLRGGRVLFIGSGTHHPAIGKGFGFRGAQFTSIVDLAQGKSSAEDVLQRNRDRYATSKFLNMVTAVELARRGKPYQTYALDPGLMPGTGLARSYGGLAKFIWKNVLPLVGFMLPETSNPAQSASVAAWIMTEMGDSFPNGSIIDYKKRPCRVVWEEVLNPTVGTAVYEQTMRFLDGLAGAPSRRQ